MLTDSCLRGSRWNNDGSPAQAVVERAGYGAGRHEGSAISGKNEMLLQGRAFLAVAKNQDLLMD